MAKNRYCIGRKDKTPAPADGIIFASSGTFAVTEAMNPNVFGGLLSGGLHAVTGKKVNFIAITFQF
jgi:hypothetical protein